MAVLVTGGAGYIGSHMVLRLADAGEKVVVLDNLSTGVEWAVDGRAVFVNGNAGDIALVAGLIKEYGVGEIIHFAGSIIVPESVENPLKYYANNTTISRNLLETAVANGVKYFIFSSTAAVYGMVGGSEAVEEATAPAPVSPYGRSKLMTEMMLADAAQAHPLTYGVMRYFNVAGADPAGRTGQSSPNATHLLKVAVQAALGQRERLYINGTDYDTPDGTCIRDYIHVTDLAEAHALLLDYLRRGGASTTLNCGYGRGFSVREVIETVRKVTGADFEVEDGPRRPGDPDSIVANADRMRKLLNWTPAHDDLEEIVASAFAWEKYLMTRNAP